MSSSDPAVRSQRLALLELYLNASPLPSIPNFPTSQSENQLPSFRSSDLQSASDSKKLSKQTTLPSLNEFIKPIFQSSNQCSSDSSPFHPHSLSSNGPSNTSIPPNMNSTQPRYQYPSNTNSNNIQFTLNDQNRTPSHRNTPSPVQAAPSLSILAQAATPTDQYQEYQRKDPLENSHCFAPSSYPTQYPHANAISNTGYIDEPYRRIMSGFHSANNNNNTISNPGNASNSLSMYQPSHHHNLQELSQGYHNPNMPLHRFHTTASVQPPSGYHSGSSSGSSYSSSSGTPSGSPGIYHNFDSGKSSGGSQQQFSTDMDQAVSFDPNMSQIKEHMEEKKKSLSSQAKIEDNINLMQMLLNTPGSLIPETNSFTEHLLDIYNRFHDSESARLLPAMLAPTQNLHNNSTIPIDSIIETKPTHVNSSS